jgi:hypothetical protein
LEWESRWATPAALAALAAVALVIAAIVVATQAVGNGSGDAALLRDVDQHRTAQMISSILQAIGVALLAAPLYYLFRAAQARSETMRGQLVGVVVAAPLFLAVLAILSGVSTLHAATDFIAKGVLGTGDHANNVASDTISAVGATFTVGGVPTTFPSVGDQVKITLGGLPGSLGTGAGTSPRQ